MPTLRSKIAGFLKKEDGSATIETVIWIPIFVWVMALIINVSMVVFEKNQAYRIVQNANRILSTGYMKSESETEAYIANALTGIAPNARVETKIENGVITSNVYYKVSDLLLPVVVENLADIWINISAQHFVEY